jgi:hypothetical protein
LSSLSSNGAVHPYVLFGAVALAGVVSATYLRASLTAPSAKHDFRYVMRFDPPLTVMAALALSFSMRVAYCVIAKKI